MQISKWLYSVCLRLCVHIWWQMPAASSCFSFSAYVSQMCANSVSNVISRLCLFFFLSHSDINWIPLSAKKTSHLRSWYRWLCSFLVLFVIILPRNPSVWYRLIPAYLQTCVPACMIPTPCLESSACRWPMYSLLANHTNWAKWQLLL